MPSGRVGKMHTTTTGKFYITFDTTVAACHIYGCHYFGKRTSPTQRTSEITDNKPTTWSHGMQGNTNIPFLGQRTKGLLEVSRYGTHSPEEANHIKKEKQNPRYLPEPGTTPEAPVPSRFLLEPEQPTDRRMPRPWLLE